MMKINGIIDELTEWTREHYGTLKLLMFQRKESVQIIITDHHCFECGFVGEAPAAFNKVECPQCKTLNDVWFNGKVPNNHTLQIEANVRENAHSPILTASI